MGSTPSVTTGRLRDVDLAKGFAIALVVWGHIAGASTPDAPLWFNLSVTVIYSFHMPFFMYLSGYVFFVINAQERFLSRPGRYTAQRFDRLMVPFIGFAVIVVLGKYLARSLGPVDDNVSSIGTGIYDVITNSPDNPCIAVWYLLCLFVYSVVAPVLWWAGRKTMGLILLVGGLGWIVPLPEKLYLSRIALYFIFFGAGGFIAVHRAIILPYIKRAFPLSLMVFAILCYVMIFSKFAMLVCGLAAIPTFHGMFLQRSSEKYGLLAWLGNYSLTIYLFNTIVIGIAKLVYLPHLSYIGAWFFLFVTLLLLAGLLVPIILLKGLKVLPRSRAITRYLQ